MTFTEGKEKLRPYMPAFVAGFAGAVLCAIIIGIGLYAYAASSGAQSRVAAFVKDQIAAVGIPPVADSTGDTSAVVSVVEKVNPSVVAIVISKEVPVISQNGYNPFSGFTINGVPVFNIPDSSGQSEKTRKQEVGGGSGFVVSVDGYVVTNAHVVEDDTAEYTVFLNDGTSHVATIVGKDDTLDIALLKIDAQDLTPLSFGDSDALKVGQTVIAIGNALGEFRNTVSVGVVSGLARSLTAQSGAGQSEQLSGVIQTDAAINSGNSGGPLLDLAGNVIGVNVAAAQGNSQSIGFALPSNDIKDAVTSLMTTGKVSRPRLGVRTMPVTQELKDKNDLTVDYGALVTKGETPTDLAVIPGSPADKAGIVENDIILEVDGVKVDNNHPLVILLRKKKVGDVVTLKVLHKGNEEELQVTLDAMPETSSTK